MQVFKQKLNDISKEEFEEKLVQIVKLGIKTWQRRRLIIEADANFDPKTYQRIPQESGMVCDICSSRNIPDPLKLSHIFKSFNEALSMGNKELVLKSIDDGILAAKMKVKEIYGRDI